MTVSVQHHYLKKRFWVLMLKTNRDLLGITLNNQATPLSFIPTVPSHSTEKLVINHLN